MACFEVLEHVADDTAVLAQIYRVLLFNWLPKRVHDRWARARIYRRREVVELVRRTGFSVLYSAYVTAPLDVLKWRKLRGLLRSKVFRSDITHLPMKATSVLVVAEKKW